MSKTRCKTNRKEKKEDSCRPVGQVLAEMLEAR